MRSFTTFILLCIFSLPILARSVRYYGGEDESDDDDVCSISRPPRKDTRGGDDDYTFAYDGDWNDYLDPRGRSRNDFAYTTTAKDLRAKSGNPERADERGIVYLRNGSKVGKYKMKDIKKDDYPWTADHILELQVIAEALNRNSRNMDESYIKSIKYIANSAKNLVNLDDALNTEKGRWIEAGGGGQITKPLHDFLKKVKMEGADIAYDIDDYLLETAAIRGFGVRDGYGPVEREWRAYLRTVGIKYTRCEDSDAT